MNRWAVGGLVLLVATACHTTDVTVAPATTSRHTTTTTSIADVAALGPRPSTTSTSTTSTSTTSTTSSTTSTSTSTTTSTVPGLTAAVSFAFSGDILPHSPLWRRAALNAEYVGGTGYLFDPMLTPLAAIHDTVDVAVCHLETPVAPPGEELSTSPYYGVPVEIVDAIAAAGFDRCSTASNHTMDRGTAGIDATVAAFERVGVAQDGMARTPDEITPTTFVVNGVAVSHLSYTWSYNGMQAADGEAWRSRLIDVERILGDATYARLLGAEAVIVSLHWGAERVTEPTQFQREVADALTASGLVDVIVGHHAHVVQPIEQVNGHWVMFGLGNVLSNLPTESFPVNSQDAMVVTLTLRRAADGTITFDPPVVHPTWVDRQQFFQIRLVQTELARPDLPPGQRVELERSLARTTSVVGTYLAPPPPSPTTP